MIRKLRTQKIEIDFPTERSPIWVRATIQRIIRSEDGSGQEQVIDMVDSIHRNVNNVATETVSVYDPVLQRNIEVSVAGISEAITAIILSWIKERHPGRLDEAGDYIEDPI